MFALVLDAGALVRLGLLYPLYLGGQVAYRFPVYALDRKDHLLGVEGHLDPGRYVDYHGVREAQLHGDAVAFYGSLETYAADLEHLFKFFGHAGDHVVDAGPGGAEKRGLVHRALGYADVDLGVLYLGVDAVGQGIG